MMKSLLPAAAMTMSLAAAPLALAADGGIAAMTGTYLLTQPNESQRVIALKPGGGASMVSQGQHVRGYTSGLGTWQMTGPDSARAAIIDFNDPVDTDDGNGASHSVYDLTFSDAVGGRFQAVTGAFEGKAFARGQNPLGGDTAPMRTFGNQFDGLRIGVE